MCFHMITYWSRFPSVKDLIVLVSINAVDPVKSKPTGLRQNLNFSRIGQRPEDGPSLVHFCIHC